MCTVLYHLYICTTTNVRMSEKVKDLPDSINYMHYIFIYYLQPTVVITTTFGTGLRTGRSNWAAMRVFTSMFTTICSFVSTPQKMWIDFQKS